MRADYDSEADALSIELVTFEHFDDKDQVDEDYCNVGFVGGRVAAVELLGPAKHVELLAVAAERYDLDGTALLAAAQAALAAPDRSVTLAVAAPVAA